MKKLVLVLLLLGVSPAFAGGEYIPYYFHHHHMVKPPVTGGSGPSTPGATQPWCSGGCLWVGGFILAVASLIVIDEVRQAMGGPCATMKPRRSWFGMTPDAPKLWHPLCKVNVVSVRG